MASEFSPNGHFVKTANHCSNGTEDDRVRELLEANTNWQKYDNEREVHIKRLQEENASKDKRISELQAQVAAANKMCQTSEESRKQLEKEKTELAGELRKAMDKVQELTNRLGDAGASSELLQVREEQVKAYKEDFESERRDRERAQSRLADVEMELEIVKRELRQYNLREMEDLHQRRQASLEYHRQEYLSKNPQSVYQRDHYDDRNPEDGEDEIDG